MVTETVRPHRCQRDGCDSQATSKVRVRLRLPVPGELAKAITLDLSMEVCDRHHDAAREFVLSDDNKRIITLGLLDAGLPEPDFLSTQFEFVPIEQDPVTVIVGCDRAGCANPAKWQVRQVFPEIGRTGKPRITAMTNLCVCDKHMRSTKPKDLLDPDSRKRTWAWLNKQGVLLPELDKATIEFVPLAGGQRAVAV